LELNENLIFARAFFRQPRMLGSLVPSSRFLVNRVLDGADLASARLVVEFGPGVGAFTRELLRRLPASATLLAIESNPDLVLYLRQSLTDPRLLLAPASAQSVVALQRRFGLPEADVIISGVPFSVMSPSKRDKIVRNAWRALRPGGRLLVYQFSGAVLPSLRHAFGEIHQEFEPLNILPARIFRCTRNGKRGLAPRAA